MKLSRRDLHRIVLGIGAVALVPVAARQAIVLGAKMAAPDPLALVDPELLPAARMLMERGFPPMTREALPAIRAGWVTPPLLPAPEVVQKTIPGPAGAPPVPIELISPGPSARLRPAILHIHGGGMISGRARHLTAFCQSLAAEFGAVVVNVDYRLSPETPFPGPVLDNYAALEWMAANAQSLGIDPARIAIIGESAGGGLAAMVALMARDRGKVPLCQIVLIYPMLDDRTGSMRAVPPQIGRIGWTAEENRFGWSSFLGAPAGSEKVPRGSVPARERNLAGLPPTFIGVGTLDLFADEDIAFSRRLIAAGVKTNLHVTPGAWHGFDIFVPEARVSRAFTAAWKADLRSAFGS
ncbi:hypothetical protein NSE01_05780 [Novosphingobium sediminis]|uniref:Alpha/beta hydrolase fold-3 domain-containing protein n=1 Tax=Novosphingobium sediminis TaxID=707214 RepID=A0A512AGA9_9SPHN|nr:alpha/beta hydrolase [Novosphingobium sediminis]GEN98745.1 hypothetical protein NSE01_05780 [Novosphingobium sediminis]